MPLGGFLRRLGSCVQAPRDVGEPSLHCSTWSDSSPDATQHKTQYQMAGNLEHRNARMCSSLPRDQLNRAPAVYQDTCPSGGQPSRAYLHLRLKQQQTHDAQLDSETTAGQLRSSLDPVFASPAMLKHAEVNNKKACLAWLLAQAQTSGNLMDMIQELVSAASTGTRRQLQLDVLLSHGRWFEQELPEWARPEWARPPDSVGDSCEDSWGRRQPDTILFRVEGKTCRDNHSGQDASPSRSSYFPCSLIVIELTPKPPQDLGSCSRPDVLGQMSAITCQTKQSRSEGFQTVRRRSLSYSDIPFNPTTISSRQCLSACDSIAGFDWDPEFRQQDRDQSSIGACSNRVTKLMRAAETTTRLTRPAWLDAGDAAVATDPRVRLNVTGVYGSLASSQLSPRGSLRETLVDEVRTPVWASSGPGGAATETGPKGSFTWAPARHRRCTEYGDNPGDAGLERPETPCLFWSTSSESPALASPALQLPAAGSAAMDCSLAGYLQGPTRTQTWSLAAADSWTSCTGSEDQPYLAPAKPSAELPGLPRLAPLAQVAGSSAIVPNLQTPLSEPVDFNRSDFSLPCAGLPVPELQTDELILQNDVSIGTTCATPTAATTAPPLWPAFHAVVAAPVADQTHGCLLQLNADGGGEMGRSTEVRDLVFDPFNSVNFHLSSDSEEYTTSGDGCSPIHALERAGTFTCLAQDTSQQSTRSGSFASKKLGQWALGRSTSASSLNGRALASSGRWLTSSAPAISLGPKNSTGSSSGTSDAAAAKPPRPSPWRKLMPDTTSSGQLAAASGSDSSRLLLPWTAVAPAQLGDPAAEVDEASVVAGPSPAAQGRTAAILQAPTPGPAALPRRAQGPGRALRTANSASGAGCGPAPSRGMRRSGSMPLVNTDAAVRVVQCFERVSVMYAKLGRMQQLITEERVPELLAHMDAMHLAERHNMTKVPSALGSLVLMSGSALTGPARQESGTRAVAAAACQAFACAQELLERMPELERAMDLPAGSLRMGIGFHCGPAALVSCNGALELTGEATDLASGLAGTCAPGCIHTSAVIHDIMQVVAASGQAPSHVSQGWTPQEGSSLLCLPESSSIYTWQWCPGGGGTEELGVAARVGLAAPLAEPGAPAQALALALATGAEVRVPGNLEPLAGGAGGNSGGAAAGIRTARAGAVAVARIPPGGLLGGHLLPAQPGSLNPLPRPILGVGPQLFGPVPPAQPAASTLMTQANYAAAAAAGASPFAPGPRTRPQAFGPSCRWPGMAPPGSSPSPDLPLFAPVAAPPGGVGMEHACLLSVLSSQPPSLLRPVRAPSPASYDAARQGVAGVAATTVGTPRAAHTSRRFFVDLDPQAPLQEPGSFGREVQPAGADTPRVFWCPRRRCSVASGNESG